METRAELLAPAGNMEGFYGAIHAGADAVYLGGERFGARAYADNFTTEELLDSIRYAHLWGRRVYLTVNTLVKETEREEILTYLRPFYEGGLDGVIVQDIGVFTLIRDHFPGLALHVSTQMTLTGKYGAGLLQRMGAARVVPARELSLSEIIEMKKATGLEVETFIHGAMCYCYSGQCLFSSMLGGRSGNRGRCAQPCRLPYLVERDKGVTGECYPLSLKDMCTIEHLPELIEAGIDSFKIEGRMKKPEYAAGVTAIYRKYIDRYYTERRRAETAGAGQGCDWRVEQSDLDALASLYIRSGRQDGYYHRHNGRDMVTLDNPSYSGSDETLLAAIRARYLDRRPRMKLSVRAEFKIGQPAKVTFSLEDREKLLRVTAVGEPVSGALKQPVTEENITKQLGKLGDTVFQAENMEVLLDAGAFYPLKALNGLRRQAAALLEDALIAEKGFSAARSFSEYKPAEAASWDRKTQEPAVMQRGSGGHGINVGTREREDGFQYSGRNTPVWHVSLQSREQLKVVADYVRESRMKGTACPARVCLDAGLLTEAAQSADKLFFTWCGELRSGGCELILALPYILRKRDEGFLEDLWNAYQSNRELFAGFLARSMDGIGFLWKKETEEPGGRRTAVYGDAGLYVWNRAALQSFENLADGFGLKGFCLPWELRASDQRRLLGGGHMPCEKMVYGRIPLMITANCVVNTIDGCDRGRGGRVCYLTDRYRKRFPVFRDCRHCVNVIYNSVPLSLHGELAKWKGETAFRLQFTLENGDETKKILRYFAAGAMGQPPFGEYTTGHEKRGAE